jgi:hypothetical protein
VSQAVGLASDSHELGSALAGFKDSTPAGNSGARSIKSEQFPALASGKIGD